MADSDDKSAIVYDITRFNRSQVVEKLEDIFKDRGYQKKKSVFYLGICRVDETLEFRKLFRLKQDPWPYQPGNMTVLQGREFISKFYDGLLVEKLNKQYGCKTSLFAKHLENLFEDNTNIAGYPFVTSEVYILWLFEIARRRVKDSEEMKKYNKLKIDGAITNLIALMKADHCGFDAVFLEGGEFHCFSGKPENIKTVIKKIKETKKSLEQA
ncbi:unnamed protein product [Pocillopora meandrina]|uniref:Uncharacterized protein n=1 Tax=Pocillopora meandrina TaxID=46732 RepID=A0AAU9XBI7_9CNID|nr:unnamed protein product [Pocillopora meandrina]